MFSNPPPPRGAAGQHSAAAYYGKHKASGLRCRPNTMWRSLVQRKDVPLQVVYSQEAVDTDRRSRLKPTRGRTFI